MTTRTHRPDAGPHDTHDRLLIAARAAGDLTGRDLDRAEVLLAACDRCRALLEELRAIAAATRHLPPAPRPPALDFRLTPDRAAALARGRGWRRFLRPFGRTGIGAVRPLAAAFTTLGVAGLLLAALPMLPFAGAAHLPDRARREPRRRARPTTRLRPCDGPVRRPELRPPRPHGTGARGGRAAAPRMSPASDEAALGAAAGDRPDRRWAGGIAASPRRWSS